jgi:hypothetical protein
MKQVVDILMDTLPYILIVIVLICLIYSEFAGVCITWDDFSHLLYRVFVGRGIKVLE